MKNTGRSSGRMTRILAGASALSVAIVIGVAPAWGTSVTVPNASFETGDLTDWSSMGDVAVLSVDPCLQPQLPSDGAYAACLSTEDLFGGNAIGNLRSDLVSPPVLLPFRPKTIRVSFDYEYGTEELERSILFNDTITVTLLTAAGPIPLLATDSWGVTPEGKGLTRTGTVMEVSPNPGCPVTTQSGRVSVKYKRGIPTVVRDAVFNAPVQLQFSVSDQGDGGRLTFLCIDNLTIDVSKN